MIVRGMACEMLCWANDVQDPAMATVMARPAGSRAHPGHTRRSLTPIAKPLVGNGLQRPEPPHIVQSMSKEIESRAYTHLEAYIREHLPGATLRDTRNKGRGRGNPDIAEHVRVLEPGRVGCAVRISSVDIGRPQWMAGINTGRRMRCRRSRLGASGRIDDGQVDVLAYGTRQQARHIQRGFGQLHLTSATKPSSASFWCSVHRPRRVAV